MFGFIEFKIQIGSVLPLKVHCPDFEESDKLFKVWNTSFNVTFSSSNAGISTLCMPLAITTFGPVGFLILAAIACRRALTNSSGLPPLNLIENLWFILKIKVEKEVNKLINKKRHYYRHIS